MVTLNPQLGKLCETAHPSLLKIHIVFFALFNEFLEAASFMTRLAGWCQTPANHLLLAKCKKPRWSNTLTSKGKWFGWLHYCVWIPRCLGRHSMIRGLHNHHVLGSCENGYCKDMMYVKIITLSNQHYQQLIVNAMLRYVDYYSQSKLWIASIATYTR